MLFKYTMIILLRIMLWNIIQPKFKISNEDFFLNNIQPSEGLITTLILAYTTVWLSNIHAILYYIETAILDKINKTIWNILMGNFLYHLNL